MGTLPVSAYILLHACGGAVNPSCLQVNPCPQFRFLEGVYLPLKAGLRLTGGWVVAMLAGL